MSWSFDEYNLKLQYNKDHNSSSSYGIVLSSKGISHQYITCNCIFKIIYWEHINSVIGKRKRKGSDNAPTPTEKPQKQRDNTKMPPKTLKTQ